MKWMKRVLLGTLVMMIPATTTVYALENKPQDSPYPNGDLLVSTQWLEDNLNTDNLVILDIRKVGDQKQLIPRAVRLNPGTLDSNRGSAGTAALKAQLEAMGLEKDMKLIVYDNDFQVPGKTQWVFWALEYLGFEDVHVLDGGIKKWVREGRPTIPKPRTLAEGRFDASPSKSLRATTAQVRAAAGNPKYIILDVRNEAEYNGWPLNGLERGGHIPGALNISLNNLLYPGKGIPPFEKVSKLLQDRGVSPDKAIIVCPADDLSGGTAYFLLRLAGYPHCALYEDSMVTWASQKNLPMEKLPRYEKLVYARWVKDLMDGKNPPTFAGNKFVILETRYEGKSISQPGQVQEFAYIPGAISIHPCYLEHGNNTAKYYPKYSEPSDGNLLPPEKLKEALEKLGITKDTTVVVYGNGKIIPMTSARVAWALMYAGVKDVRILDGGFTAWTAKGLPVTNSPATPVPVSDFGTTVPAHPEYLATTDYVEEISEGRKPSSALVEVRRIEEHRGEINPYGFFEKKGRIPGCVWMGDWNTLVNVSNNTFRSQSEIMNIWKNLGVTPDKEPVFYCGTGWRSSMGFFFAYVAGFEKLRNYDGSFYEWSWQDSHPVTISSSK